MLNYSEIEKENRNLINYGEMLQLLFDNFLRLSLDHPMDVVSAKGIVTSLVSYDVFPLTPDLPHVPENIFLCQPIKRTETIESNVNSTRITNNQFLKYTSFIIMILVVLRGNG